MKTLLEIFPRASQSTVAANPHLVATNGASGNKNESGGILKRKKGMTGVEQEFGLMLEAQKRNGEILRYEFQGITLRWGVDEKTGDSMKYSPDFVVFYNGLDDEYEDHSVRLIEVKGPHIHYRQQAIARFKGCRSDWPEFQFELHQKQKGGEWKQIL